MPKRNSKSLRRYMRKVVEPRLANKSTPKQPEPSPYSPGERRLLIQLGHNRKPSEGS